MPWEPEQYGLPQWIPLSSGFWVQPMGTLAGNEWAEASGRAFIPPALSLLVAGIGSWQGALIIQLPPWAPRMAPLPHLSGLVAATAPSSFWPWATAPLDTPFPKFFPLFIKPSRVWWNALSWPSSGQPSGSARVPTHSRVVRKATFEARGLF